MKGSTIIPFVTDIDYNIGKWLNGMLHSTNGRFTPILKFITSLGNVGIAFIITALIMLLFLRTRKVGMLLLVSMLLGIILTNLILKNVIARPRPYLNQYQIFIYGGMKQVLYLKRVIHFHLAILLPQWLLDLHYFYALKKVYLGYFC